MANRAACWLKTEYEVGCIEDCTKGLGLIEAEEDILKKEFKNDDGDDAMRKNFKLKFLIRRGTAYSHLQEKSKALQDYDLAICLDPSNESLRQDVELLQKA